MQADHGTAKIYQFPVRDRSLNAARQAEARAEALRLSLIPCIDFGSGWYHDAAIEEEAPKPVAAPSANVSPLVRH